MRHNLKQKGFTLVEILIALFIFSIISIILSANLKQMIETEKHVTAQTNQFSQLQMFLILFERDIHQLIDRSIMTINDSMSPSLQGSTTQIEFTRGGNKTPSFEKRSHLLRVRYELSEGKLVRKTWNAIDRTAKTIRQTRVLLNDVSAMKITYIDQSHNQNMKWPATNEKSSGKLPLAIRLQLTSVKLGKMTQVYPMYGSSLEESNNEK